MLTYDKKKDILIINGVTVDNSEMADSEVDFQRATPDSEIKVGINGGVQNVITGDQSGTLTFSVYDGSNVFKALFALKESQIPMGIYYKRGNIDLPITGFNCVVAKLSRSGGDSSMVEVNINCGRIIGT